MAFEAGPLLTSTLERYGLGSLAGWLSQRLIENASQDELLLELYDRPEFKAAYPEIEARRQLAEQRGMTMVPISPDDVLDYRSAAGALMRSYGLPSAFWGSKEAFFDLIVNDVPLDELEVRLRDVRNRVIDAPLFVRDVFGELFGAEADDALYAVFLDHERAVPELENMLQTAEAGGAARRFGFRISEAEMARLERENLTYGEAVQGFGLLDAQRNLFEETLFEEGVDFTVGEEGIEAAFSLEGGAAERLVRRGQTRAAQTQGAGGLASDRRGAVGFGAASQE